MFENIDFFSSSPIRKITRNTSSKPLLFDALVTLNANSVIYLGNVLERYSHERGF